MEVVVEVGEVLERGREQAHGAAGKRVEEVERGADGCDPHGRRAGEGGGHGRGG